MADVSKVQGPSGPPENLGKKDKVSPDSDKFKQEMHKVTKVSETDPDEQKKRKQRGEAEEEDAATQAQPAPTPPPAHVTPFSLTQETKKPSLTDLQKGGPGTSPMASAQPAPPAPPQTTFFLSPSPEEMTDDSGMLEEVSFEETMPSYPTPTAGGAGTTSPSVPVAQPTPSQGPGAAAQPQQLTPTPSDLGTPLILPSSESAQQDATGGGSSSQGGAAQGKGTQKGKGRLTAASLEGTPASKPQDTSKFFEQIESDIKAGKQGKTPEEVAKELAEMQGVGTPPPISPFAQTLEEEKEREVEGIKKGAEMETTGLSSGMGEPSMMANLSPPPPESLPSYAHLNPQVMDLFDRMVGVMTVMTMSGMTETTVTLNMPKFASSVFFGTQIIIQEFSTAPKAFNIQLNGTPQAVALFQGNADDLMAAFQSGNYNYRINRLQTGYLSDKPLFKRKEKIADKDQEKGENPQ